MVELRGDQRPALVLGPDAVRDRHAHVRVIGDVRALTAERVDRREGEALRARRHQDDRDALVLRRVGIGARREPDPVGVVGVGGVALLPVDHVLVAVAHGARRERGEIGARAGLGVAHAEEQLALHDAGQQLRLLLRRSVLHQRRSDRVDGDDRERRARAIGLVPEDELLDRRAALAAVLARPADPQPAVLAHPPDHFAEDGSAHLFPLGIEGRAQLGREELAVVAADLLAQPLLLGRELEMHRASALRRRAAAAGGRPRDRGAVGRTRTCSRGAARRAITARWLGPSRGGRARHRSATSQQRQPLSLSPEGSGYGEARQCLRWLLVLLLIAPPCLAVSRASALTIDVIGANGAVGTAGGPATATAAGADASNSARARGGEGGAGTAAIAPGAGGFADATATVSAIGAASAQADARGGDGGGADSADHSGSGGGAIASASAEGSLSALAYALARGGSGGDGGSGVTGGNGGDATANAAARTSGDWPRRSGRGPDVLGNAVTGAYGGWPAFFGVLTSGGNAASESVGEALGNSSVRVFDHALGGEGALGGAGGSASSSAVGRNAGSEAVEVVAQAQGGRGGGAYGTPNLDGGNGGEARLGRVYGASIDGDVSVIASVGGGSGGDGVPYSSQSSGDGASVVLVDAIDGDTSGNLYLSRAPTAVVGAHTERALTAKARARSTSARTSPHSRSSRTPAAETKPGATHPRATPVAASRCAPSRWARADVPRSTIRPRMARMRTHEPSPRPWGTATR